jgi:hypothetical protein
LHTYQQLEGDEEEELDPLKCKARTTTETELVRHNNNKQTNNKNTQKLNQTLQQSHKQTTPNVYYNI